MDASDSTIGMVISNGKKSALKHKVLLAGHDNDTAAHLGIFKTYEKLCALYYW